MIVKQKQIWSLFPFVSLLLTLALVMAGCGGTPTPKPQPTLALKVRPDTTEVQAGESVAIVAEVEPLEKLDLEWSVSGTAEGTLNTDTGEQVVYTAGKEGIDIVVAEGTTASGVHVKQTVNLTVVGETECQITEPADGDDNLGHENDVRATCSDVPDSRYIWVLVYSHNDHNYYPQPGPMRKSGSQYSGKAYLGIAGTGKDKGIGDEFEIIVALADATANAKLQSAAANHEGWSVLPDGIEEKDSITVKRGH